MTKKYLNVVSSEYAGPEPMAYRLHAYAFLQCAEYAIRGYRSKHATEPNMMQNAPLVHMICHAVEMFLKLAVYKTGSTDQDLKALQLRHNLVNLKASCEQNGVAFSAEVSQMIEALSPLHARHVLRYTAFVDEPVWLPFTPEEMIELAKKLVTASHPSQSS